MSRDRDELGDVIRAALARHADADALAAAADARALELSTGDVTFGRRLIFAAGIAAISRDQAIIDLSTPELAREAPNTCAVLNQALLIGIRTRLWD